MTPIELLSTVGPDGVLKLSVPVGMDAANREVRITVESLEDDESTSNMSEEAWRQLVKEMAGSITDPTFVRPEQGIDEERGEMFP